MVDVPPSPTVRIGISSCLLGEKVRFDGGDKRAAFVDTLGSAVEWVPVCPEVEAGLGVPREPIRLVRAASITRLVGVDTGADRTEVLVRFSTRRAAALAHAGLDGYVFKRDSPSCGLGCVKVYGEGRAYRRVGRGVFASALVSRLPLLPAEEEGRLADPALLERFVERVFACRRLRDFFAGRWTLRGLREFHAANSALLRARSPGGFRALGRLVVRAGSMPRAALRAGYEAGFVRALAQ